MPTVSVCTGARYNGNRSVTLNNPFFATMKDGAEAKAEELATAYRAWFSKRPKQRAANIEDLTIRGVKAPINPTDLAAVSNAIRMANRSNIPVLTLDRGAVVVSRAHIASDNVIGGEMAGHFIKEKWAKKRK